MNEKTCTKCHQIKSLDQFRIKRGYYYPSCKDCERQSGKEYRHRLNNRQSVEPITEKKCCDCKRILPVSNFRSTKYNKDGYQTVCRECATVRHMKAVRQQQQLDPIGWAMFRMVLAAQARSRMQNLEFDLTVEWMFEQFGDQTKCPILGYDLIWISTCPEDRPHVASIDRIDSAFGYTRDNVWVICELANRMKTNASLDDIQRFAAFYGRSDDWPVTILA
jgi:hypothetical protein